MSLLKHLDRHVVWTRDMDALHKAKDDYSRVAFKYGESKTVCRRLVHCPIVKEPDMFAKLTSGTQNCPKCFK